MCSTDEHFTIQQRYIDYKEAFEKDVETKTYESFKEYFHYDDVEAAIVTSEFGLTFK
jgi:hypothetical protein